MDKFQELFACYPFEETDALILEHTQQLLAQHTAENQTSEVWRKCLSLIDLTTLNAEDTTEKVAQMAEKVNLFRQSFPALPSVAAICVYPSMVETVKQHLTQPIHIASVAAGFPASQTFIEIKIAEASMAVHEGADEIDIVLPVGKFLEGNYQEVHDEIAELKDTIRPATLKVILETGALKTADNIWKASILAMNAGADFIKTSTGKIALNATPEACYTMCHAIRAWKEKTNNEIGFKAAGGISTTEEAVQYYTLVKEILGANWLSNRLFRLGASRLSNQLLSSIQSKETIYF